MITLAEFMIIAGADNRPPMLKKSMYDSWKSRMELYMKNTENERMILNLYQNDPLVWPTIVQEDGTTRTKKYEELPVIEKLQADYDLKATNIVLQGLPPDVYAIVNHHKVAKGIWDRVKLLMQDTKLSLQERECKLYDEFDSFSFVKGETLYKHVNETNSSEYKVFEQSTARMEQIYDGCEDGTTRTKKYEELPVIEKLQADYDLKATNIVLQGLPPDVYAIVNHHKVAKGIWDRVKLLMQDTKLSLQERECKLYDEFDSFSFVKGETLYKHVNETNSSEYKVFEQSTARMEQIYDGWRQGQSYAGIGYKGNATSFRGNNAGGQPKVVKCYNFQGERHMARQCTQPKRPRNAAWFKDKAMLVEAQESGQILDEEQLAFLADPGIPDAVLMANLSNYGSDVISEVPYSESYHNVMDNQSVNAMQDFEQTPVVDFPDNKITSDSNIIPYSQYLQEIQQAAVQDTNLYAQQDSMILSVIEQMSEQIINLVNN
nr:retrovirus-related Pol polyprotein from transposon TNT 1-94 [Tanacetum cinerariifolium]